MTIRPYAERFIGDVQMIVHDNEAVFPLGMYDLPKDQGEWRRWQQAGINLLRCNNEEQLDEARRRGMMAWVPVPMICGSAEDERALGERIRSLRDNAAVVAWEAQDEAIWRACRLDEEVVTNRIWAQPPDVRAAIRSRLDSVVTGLHRGSSIVRELDPVRRLWLNEAAKSDQETLARCLPYLDVVSYDYYPVPEDPRRGRQMHMLAGFTDRFRRTAPSKDVWVVEQSFTWGGMSRASPGKKELIHDYNTNTWHPLTEEESKVYPSVEEFRFMAWIAICHGATGLLWFGSAFESRPSPLLDNLMAVVSELSGLQPFLAAGDVARVRAITDERQCPSTLGVCATVRRGERGTLLALVNQDYVEHDVTVTGLDWVGASDLKPMFDSSESLRGSGEGMITTMRGHEVRLYLAP